MRIQLYLDLHWGELKGNPKEEQEDKRLLSCYIHLHGFALGLKEFAVLSRWEALGTTGEKEELDNWENNLPGFL